MGPISKKVIAGLKKAKNQKIIQIEELREAKEYSSELENSVVTEEQLVDHDPLHAIYIYAQNRVSVLVEQLADLKSLSKLTGTLDQADDIYLPSSPPQSPLTQSYFTCWGFFDWSVGIKKESFGTVIIDLLKYLKADTELIKIIECMQNSRMGIYIHKGIIDRYVILEEFITGEEIKAFVSGSYQGNENEIWYIRVMPAPFPDLNYEYSVALTTPYVLVEIKDNQIVPASKTDWEAFFDRNFKKTEKQDQIKEYETLMKYGKNKYFWNEFIFEGYASYEKDMIMLAGFPDIPLSMPHSEASQKMRGEI